MHPRDHPGDVMLRSWTGADLRSRSRVILTSLGSGHLATVHQIARQPEINGVQQDREPCRAPHPHLHCCSLGSGSSAVASTQSVMCCQGSYIIHAHAFPFPNPLHHPRFKPVLWHLAYWEPLSAFLRINFLQGGIPTLS